MKRRRDRRRKTIKRKYNTRRKTRKTRKTRQNKKTRRKRKTKRKLIGGMEAAPEISPDIEQVKQLFTNRGWPIVREYLNTTNQPVPETMTGNVIFFDTFKGKPLGSDELYDCKLEQDFGDGRFLVHWLGVEDESPGGKILQTKEKFSEDDQYPRDEREFRDEDRQRILKDLKTAVDIEKKIIVHNVIINSMLVGNCNLQDYGFQYLSLKEHGELKSFFSREDIFSKLTPRYHIGEKLSYILYDFKHFMHYEYDESFDIETLLLCINIRKIFNETIALNFFQKPNTKVSSIKIGYSGNGERLRNEICDSYYQKHVFKDGEGKECEFLLSPIKSYKNNMIELRIDFPSFFGKLHLDEYIDHPNYLLHENPNNNSFINEILDNIDVPDDLDTSENTLSTFSKVVNCWLNINNGPTNNNILTLMDKKKVKKIERNHYIYPTFDEDYISNPEVFFSEPVIGSLEGFVFISSESPHSSVSFDEPYSIGDFYVDRASCEVRTVITPLNDAAVQFINEEINPTE